MTKRTNDTRIRYVAKKIDKGWGVYDTQFASWPMERAEFGRVKQDHKTEADAQAEADRLNGRAS